jgi:hypothetical protein
MNKRNYLPRVRCRGYEGDLISVEQTFCESVLGANPTARYELVISPERDVEIKIGCVSWDEIEQL